MLSQSSEEWRPPQLEAVPWGAGPNLGLPKPTECLCLGWLRRGEQRSMEYGARSQGYYQPHPLF